MSDLQFASSISDAEDGTEAALRVVADVQQRLDAVDLCLVFMTQQHRPEAVRIVERIRKELEPGAMVAVLGEGVLGVGREIERSTGLSLLAGRLPGVVCRAFHVEMQGWKTLLADPLQLPARLCLDEETRLLIGFGDAWTTPTGTFLQLLNEQIPGMPLVGGMASGYAAPGHNLLFVDDVLTDEGFVGVSLGGQLAVQTLLSQGCRPIGEPMIVTKARRNVIEQLGGLTPVQQLAKTIENMPETEQQHLANGLLIGRAITEYKDRFGRGDFLVRNLIDVNRETGAMASAEPMKPGRTVQFHVRDARSADEDYRLLLDAARVHDAPAGGLLFSCTGRGNQLFESEPDHDTRLAQAALPDTPLAGFFAAGEFGPVGGQNFIHSHSACLTLFRRP
ncbi:MAG: FIST N-terminal domain-containing protein [Phycisphaerae bacterium]